MLHFEITPYFCIMKKVEMTTLDKLDIGQSAIIKIVGGEGSRRQHFLDMGVIPDAVVKLVKYAPMGDPMEVMIHGYALTLRKADAKLIKVEPITSTIETEDDAFDVNKLYITSLPDHNAHPGLGEEGIFHDKTHENPLPKGTKLTFALAGQQNCGKTTLFNQLTGSNQHVGNFPGVTVDRKDGVIKNHPDTLVTDLPGIYSLSPYTNEEIVSREFIMQQKPKAIINIVDANNIELRPGKLRHLDADYEHPGDYHHQLRQLRPQRVLPVSRLSELLQQHVRRLWRLRRVWLRRLRK